MKRMFLMAALIMSALLPALGRPSTADANELIPSEYLNGGVLILGEASHGTAWYIDRSSVRVEQEGSPKYIISFQVFPARYDMTTGEITRVFDGSWQKCLYDVEKDRMYLYNSGMTPPASPWVYIDPVGLVGETPLDTCGEMAWYIIYKKPFYGGRQWRDSDGQSRWSNYGDEVYRRVDNSY